MVFIELLKDVIAFVSISRLVQRRKFRPGRTPASVAIYQGRQMLPLKACGCWIHDDHPFDHVTQLAHIARPGVTHEHLNRVVRDLSRATAISGCKLLEEVAGE